MDFEISYKKNSQNVEFDGNIIGFYNVEIILSMLTVEYSLYPEYRNKDIGTKFVQLVIDLVGKEYTDYKYINLLIHEENKPSLKVARNNGFTKSSDYELQEQISEEMPNYGLYSISNKYYKKEICKKLNKVL